MVFISASYSKSNLLEIEIDTKSVVGLLTNNDYSNVEPNLPMDN